MGKGLKTPRGPTGQNNVTRLVYFSSGSGTNQNQSIKKWIN